MESFEVFTAVLSEVDITEHFIYGHSIDTSPLLYYTFPEDASNKFKDQSGNNHHATEVTPLIYVNSENHEYREKNYISFDVPSYLKASLPAPHIGENNAAFTVSFSMRYPTLPTTASDD